MISNKSYIFSRYYSVQDHSLLKLLGCLSGFWSHLWSLEKDTRHAMYSNEILCTVASNLSQPLLWLAKSSKEKRYQLIDLVSHGAANDACGQSVGSLEEELREMLVFDWPKPIYVAQRNTRSMSRYDLWLQRQTCNRDDRKIKKIFHCHERIHKMGDSLTRMRNTNTLGGFRIDTKYLCALSLGPPPTPNSLK